MHSSSPGLLPLLLLPLSFSASSMQCWCSFLPPLRCCYACMHPCIRACWLAVGWRPPPAFLSSSSSPPNHALYLYLSHLPTYLSSPLCVFSCCVLVSFVGPIPGLFATRALPAAFAAAAACRPRSSCGGGGGSRGGPRPAVPLRRPTCEEELGGASRWCWPCGAAAAAQGRSAAAGAAAAGSAAAGGRAGLMARCGCC